MARPILCKLRKVGDSWGVLIPKVLLKQEMLEIGFIEVSISRPTPQSLVNMGGLKQRIGMDLIEKRIPYGKRMKMQGTVKKPKKIAPVASQLIDEETLN